MGKKGKLFKKVARYDLISNDMEFPGWKVYPQFDEMDGVHAGDYLRGRENAIREIKDGSYTVILFERTKLAREKSALYKDFNNLINSEEGVRANSFLYCFALQYVWKKVEYSGFNARQIFTIESQGMINWSDHGNYYNMSSTYPFAKDQTEFRHGGPDTYQGVRNKGNLFLVLIKNR